MHLTPLVSVLDNVLARLPFAIAEELDTSAVNKQVQSTNSAAIWKLDGQRLLPAA
jgi:hypothetical protein